MKTRLIKIILLVGFILSTPFISLAQTPSAPKLRTDPWLASQLMEPAVLAKMIREGKKIHIYNIGVVENLPGAVNMGAATEKENLSKFAQAIKNIPKNEPIVVYCGCCPFERCPNIRPAFILLKEQRFSKAMLLNLPTNLRKDWINKGYPIE